MKYIWTILIFLLPSLVLAQDNNQYKKDSLRNAVEQTEGEENLKAYMRLTAIYFAESKDDLKMDTLLMLYREMDKEAYRQGKTNFNGIVRGNILSAYNNRRMYDEIIRLAPGYLDELAKLEAWKYYYYCHTKLIDAYIHKGDNQTAIREAERLYAQSEKQTSDEGMAMALYAMSTVYKSQSRQEEQEKCYRQAIQLLEGNESLLSLSANIYFDLCQTLLSQERYDELLKTAAEFEKVNEQYEVFAGMPVPTTWGNLWGVYARLYVETGEYDKAEVYCDKIDSVIDSPPYKIIVYDTRARIFNARGEYEDALIMIAKASELEGFYTSKANGLRDTKMTILGNMGRYREAYELGREATLVRDSIRKMELARQIDELRTVYEVDKHVAEKERNRNYFLFALAGCLLLTLMLGIWIYYSRQITKKNRTLARQIKELTELQEINDNEFLKKVSVLSRNEEDTYEEDFCPESRKEQLCIAIRDILLKDKVYRNPTITRDYLIEQLGTNKELFSEAFQHCFNMSFPEYLNRLRLKDAIHLLERSDLSIEAISEKTGFGTVRTFQRQFRQNYNISPKAYRDSLK